jgi:hypothetical protein
MRLANPLIFIACAFGASHVYAGDAALDVQRLQQQRDQQQLELRLKMQQQQDSALRPLPNASADLQRRQLEYDQQQRQRQTQDQESRAAIVPPAEEGRNRALRELESERAAQELQRFESARRIESERVTGSGRAEPPK